MRGLFALVVTLAACAPAGAFTCSEDADCGGGGMCEQSTAFCTFPTDDCPSGWKYGAHAGNNLAGVCTVPASDGSGSGSGMSTADDDGDDGVDVDPDGMSTDEGDGTSSSDTGFTSLTTLDADTGPPPAGCVSGQVCVPAAPEGWLGPGVVFTGGPEVPTCPAALPTDLGLGHYDLSAPPATCACNCGVVDGSCATASLTVNTVDATCGIGTTYDVPEDQCTAINVGGGAAIAMVDFPGSADGTCAASPSTVVPAASWLSHAQLCGEAADDRCDEGGLCITADAGGVAVCIAQVGDVPCPEVDYTDRNVVYGDFSDTRDCSACGCAIASTLCHLQIRDGTQCNGQPNEEWPVTMPTCQNLVSIVSGGNISAELVTQDNCTDSGGAPVGDVALVSPTTLCCYVGA